MTITPDFEASVLQSKVLLYTANIFQSALFRERHVQNARII
jgi:hypothetical protein